MLWENGLGDEWMGKRNEFHSSNIGSLYFAHMHKHVVQLACALFPLMTITAALINMWMGCTRGNHKKKNNPRATSLVELWLLQSFWVYIHNKKQLNSLAFHTSDFFCANMLKKKAKHMTIAALQKAWPRRANTTLHNNGMCEASRQVSLRN